MFAHYLENSSQQNFHWPPKLSSHEPQNKKQLDLFLQTQSGELLDLNLVRWKIDKNFTLSKESYQFSQEVNLAYGVNQKPPFIVYLATAFNFELRKDFLNLYYFIYDRDSCLLQERKHNYYDFTLEIYSAKTNETLYLDNVFINQSIFFEPLIEISYGETDFYYIYFGFRNFEIK